MRTKRTFPPISLFGAPGANQTFINQSRTALQLTGSGASRARIIGMSWMSECRTKRKLLAQVQDVRKTPNVDTKVKVGQAILGCALRLSQIIPG